LPPSPARGGVLDILKLQASKVPDKAVTFGGSLKIILRDIGFPPKACRNSTEKSMRLIRTKICFSLMLLPLVLLLAGCQNTDRGTTVATYSGSIERAYESVSLTSDHKYNQKLTYHIRGRVVDVLLGSPIDLPITLYAKGTWRMVDTKTGAVIDISKLDQADIKNVDVELKGAVGPAPLQETSVHYTYLDRSIPASEFKLTSQKATGQQEN